MASGVPPGAGQPAIGAGNLLGKSGYLYGGDDAASFDPGKAVVAEMGADLSLKANFYELLYRNYFSLFSIFYDLLSNPQIVGNQFHLL